MRKSESNSTASSPILNVTDRYIEIYPGLHVLIQEEVNEEKRNHTAPLTKQLDYLTRLIQGMKTVVHSTLYPKAGTSAFFKPTGYKFDNYIHTKKSGYPKTTYSGKRKKII